MKIDQIKYCLAVSLLILVSGCSNQKNTGLTRKYHTVTSRYNILFNGWESFNSGMLKLEQNHKDNFQELLPVFIYHDPKEVSTIASEMDRSIEKGKKVISLHSITAKPELDEDKDINEKDREFYNKNEFNKWVSHSYLLMAKGHFYKQEFSEAAETFRYIISNYPDEEPHYESRIWLARIALENDRLKEVESIFEEIDADETFPEALTSDLMATKADFEIIKEDYLAAAEYLYKALETTKSKYYKQRYSYTLAQLYHLSGNSPLATEYFQKVVKLNPPYEMAFNAKINMALSYEHGAVMRKDIEKQLDKMIRDDKNIEYQDQIYYAWGNLYRQEGDEETALKYYLKSAEASAGNTSQQALTFLTIADIYYVQPRYIPAQKYYDSTVSVISPDYPNYSIIYAKSISLTNLVNNLNVIEFQDSVQKLSYMNKDDLYAYIGNVIETEKEKAEQEREKQLNAQFAATQNAQQESTTQSSKSGTSWYFYNTTAINLGRKEFKRKWGNRSLEDNWRRSNKSTLEGGGMGGFGMEGTDAEGKKDSTSKASLEKYSVEYYLADIPFTDSAKEVSNQKIKEAYVNVGDIYYQELKDYDQAVNTYETLLKRFPSYEGKLSVYYKLYTIGKITENIELVSKYQTKIINEFPNSNYARVLTDPDYFKKIEEQERHEEILYAQVYDAFSKDNHAQTIQLIEQARMENPEGKYNMQYDYMQTISEGLSKDTVEFINDLKKLISKYPKTEYADRAQMLVKYLNTSNPEAAKTQAIQQAATLYNMPDPKEEHYVLVSLAKSSDYNQLMFNVINFNIDNYSELDLKINKIDINKQVVLQVSKFKNQKLATDYFNAIKNSPDLYHDVNPNGNTLMIISKSNNAILKRDKKLKDYITFFNEKLQ